MSNLHNVVSFGDARGFIAEGERERYVITLPPVLPAMPIFGKEPRFGAASLLGYLGHAKVVSHFEI